LTVAAVRNEENNAAATKPTRMTGTKRIMDAGVDDCAGKEMTGRTVLGEPSRLSRAPRDGSAGMASPYLKTAYG
jgi:hypothetical protein